MTEEKLNAKVNEIISRMSLEDKIAFCSGEDFWKTKAFDQYGIPALRMSDGPNGLRLTSRDENSLDIRASEKATCFPPAVTVGQTWNRNLVYEEGRAIGEEAREAGIGVVLGPGINIKRNPLCGRNFEYYSEDPYVAGEMGASYVAGIQQETGVGACVKHFACNSQEYARLQSDSEMDERTMREIYLRPFEKVVKKAHPSMVMCAYNKVNGTYCSDNPHLLTDILRKEWGFNGTVVTDWGALNDRKTAFEAGCDLVMPGGSAFGEKQVRKEVKKGTLREDCIDESVKRILTLVLRRAENLNQAKEYSFDRTSHQDVARRLAEEGAVLLKNDNQVLPVEDPRDMVLIGAMAADIRCQGNGSSHVKAQRILQVTQCLPQAHWVEGCDAQGNVTEESLKEVTRAASSAKKAIVFVGLPERNESEGFDRNDLSIPEGYHRMVKAAVAGNPDTAVVLMGGGPMKLPWYDDVPAILYVGLCGQEGGEAIANILTGRVNPSGKLTETWPLEEIDIPSYGFYGKKDHCRNAQYREGIYVGYRYYDKAGQRVRFPFGYGLSYTSFIYWNLRIDHRKVSLSVSNVGSRAGSEVVQLYIGNPREERYRPVKELRAFEKVFIRPGETKEITFELEGRDFAIYDKEWRTPSGTYYVMVGSSSADIRLVQEVNVTEDTTTEAAATQDTTAQDTAAQDTTAQNTATQDSQAENTPSEEEDSSPSKEASSKGNNSTPSKEKSSEGNDSSSSKVTSSGGSDSSPSKEKLSEGNDSSNETSSNETSSNEASSKEPSESSESSEASLEEGEPSQSQAEEEDKVEFKHVTNVVNNISWYTRPSGQPTRDDWKERMGENLPEMPEEKPGSFGWNSSVADMTPYSRVNRLVKRTMEKHCLEAAGQDPENPDYKMSVATSVEAPVRSLRLFEPKVPMWCLGVLLWLGNHGI